MLCDITLNDLRSYRLNVYGSFFFEYQSDAFISILKENDIPIDQVKKISFSGDQIKIAWGRFFEKLCNLRDVVISASEKLCLNCFNFENSTVQTLNLTAPEIWLNDGVFINATELVCVSFNGKIVPLQTKGRFPELTFKGCTKLSQVNGSFFGESLMGSVFADCRSLRYPLDIYVKDLGSRAFYGCESLDKIHLHNGLENLGYGSFENCKSLRDIYVPDSVVNLGFSTFQNCVSLKTIHLPKELKRIGSNVFSGCESLNKVFLSDNLECIDSGAFEGCRSLHNVWLPDHLKKIGSHAFSGCHSIYELYIPAGIEEIGENAFCDCPNLMIKGKSGSIAEQIANGYRIPFKPCI